MSTLTEKIAEAVEKHAYVFGDCECSEYCLEVPYRTHLAEITAAVVAEWLGTDLDLLALAEDEHGMRRLDAADLLVALAAEAVKGAGQ